MSRIQDILAKAEREGTARTIRDHAADAAPSVVTRIPIALADPPSPPLAPAVATVGTFPSTAVPPATRTAQPTLHPALVAAIAPHSQVAERYRALRARVAQREELSPLRVIAITSPGTGEGKSVTAANLAIAMAQDYQRSILLLDADLRTPVVHSLFGISDRPGLSEVLSGEATLDQALIALPELRLTVLPAGAIPEYPSELLGSAAMRRTIDTLRMRFDRVVVDLPGVLPLADVRTVAPMIDGVVLVVRAGVTHRPAVDEALTTFDQQKVLGLVLNEAH
jgi:capsular exopolysaccharide synthesis family protein